MFEKFQEILSKVQNNLKKIDNEQCSLCLINLNDLNNWEIVEIKKEPFLPDNSVEIGKNKYTIVITHACLRCKELGNKYIRSFVIIL